MNIGYLFFPTKDSREYYMSKIFSKLHINVRNEKSSSIKYQNQYQKIPGYWVRIKYGNTEEDENLKKQVLQNIPKYWIDDQVFFPKHFVDNGEVEKQWMKKYDMYNQKNHSDALNAFFKEGKIHFKEGRLDLAKAAFICIYKNNPFFLKKYKRYYVFEDLAYEYQVIGQVHKSIHCLKIQATLQPDSSEPYLNMSHFLLINGLCEEAIAVCIRGLEIDPTNSFIMNNLLIGYMDCGYYEEALEFLEEQIRIDPDNCENWKFTADIFARVRKRKAAIICYKRALEYCLEDEHEMIQEIYCSMGICYENMHEDIKAIEYYEKYLEYNQEDPTVLLSLSELYAKSLKEYDRAEKYAKKLICLYPQNGYAHHHLGLIYLYTNQISRAKWYLYRARKLLPNYQPVHDAIVKLKRSL